jgi:methylamine dehydrogenase heavy chain
MYTLAYSADGHFLYAAYITPATSFAVLDPVQRKLLGEIDTAGCTMVMPSGADRISSLCESGRLLTVRLDPEGHEVARSMSPPFFDADADPVFVQAIATNDGYVFLSFLGVVHAVDLRGAQPQFAEPWSLVSDPEKGVWRPGAEQVGAIHRALGRLYVPMHRGGEGTHKDGGTEIWVFDLATHGRVARWPLPGARLTRILGIQVSQDDAPLLFATTESAQLAVLDARSGELRHLEQHMGQTPWVLFSP